MAKQADIQTVYTYIDEVARALVKNHRMSFLEGINQALNYLLDDAFSEEKSLELTDFYVEKKSKMLHRDFDKETIRKAIQLALLKGFKEANITNAQMTPDTIGIFLSYLVKKLYNNQTIQTILDPLVGTANMVAALSNHLDKPFAVHGIDDDPLMCNLARNMCDALHINHQIFLQDTLSFQGMQYDLIITDFPPWSLRANAPYLPYHVIIHHLEHLKDGHYFIALIENNFFERKDSQKFRNILQDKAHLFGLIKLDETLFTTHPKSILIIKKKTDKSETLEDFLMVDLPSFTDLKAFDKAIQKMDQWFKKKEVDVQ